MKFEDLKAHYFGDNASQYERERAPDEKWWREQNLIETLVERHTEGVERPRVIDVPVGTGRFLPKYVSLQARATGVDISSDMLSVAATKLADVVDADIVLQEGDITNLPFADDSFDLAVCIRFASLIPIDVASQAVSELTRISRRIIIGVTATSEDAREQSTVLRRAAARARWTALTLAGRQRVVVHDRADVLEVFQSRGCRIIDEQLVRSRPDLGDATSVFVLEPGRDGTQQ